MSRSCCKAILFEKKDTNHQLARTSTNFNEDQKKKDERGKLKPMPFFLTLIVEDKLLHNSMMDFGAITIVMPKQIKKALNMGYEPLERGIMYNQMVKCFKP